MVFVTVKLTSLAILQKLGKLCMASNFKSRFRDPDATGAVITFDQCCRSVTF
jgi:hypothetical protein